MRPSSIVRRIGPALVAVLLVGCGGSDGDSGGADAAAPTTAAPTTVGTAPRTGEVDTDDDAGDDAGEVDAAEDEDEVRDQQAADETEAGADTDGSGADVRVDADASDRAIDGVPEPAASTVADLLALGRPIVAAHAGGDFDAPHSTMFAFTEAALAGVDVLEMDVMLTADEVLIVHHDDTVDRTTETSGVVRDMTYAELETLDNAHWFSGDVWVDTSLPDEAYVWRGVRTGDRPPPEGYGPDDFRIETFASVAEAFPAHVLDVEIKVQRGADGEPDLARATRAAQVLADEIERLGRVESVIVVSFDDRVIEAFRGFAPSVATSPGLDTLVAWYAGAPVEFAPQDVVFQVPPVFEGIEVLTAETVDRARADGFAVWAWMSAGEQETAEYYAELIARGVDGLIVARPAVAVAAVGS